MSFGVPLDPCDSESTLASVLNSTLNVYAKEFVPLANRTDYTPVETVPEINEDVSHVDGEFTSDPVFNRMGEPPLVAASDLDVRFNLVNISIRTADIPLPPEDPRFPPPETNFELDSPATPEYLDNSNNTSIPAPFQNNYLAVLKEVSEENNNFDTKIDSTSKECKNNNVEHETMPDINQESAQKLLPIGDEKNIDNSIVNEYTKFTTENHEKLAHLKDNKIDLKITPVKAKYRRKKLSVPPKEALKLAENGQDLKSISKEPKVLPDNVLLIPNTVVSHKTAMIEASSAKSIIKEEHKVFEKRSKKKKSPAENICSKKEHVNIVFIGHVDAGKSTIGGHLMFLMGMVDKRTMEKYEKEAKEISRDSWYLSWALDTNEEERAKGKTVETGRGHFETSRKHITILDAPGHKIFVPNMICGTAQADVAVLVISARKNEFETGFENGGQTREHAMLAKSAGIANLVVLINKMDDSTVNWEKKRFDTCYNSTIKFLRKVGFKPNDIVYIPVSGQTGHGLKDKIPSNICTWYDGPTFIEYLDSLQHFERKIELPLVMPIVEKYRDMGTVVFGKVETGIVRKNQSVIIMPNKMIVSIEKIWSHDKPVNAAKAGENVKLTLKGIEEEEITPGFVLCDSLKPITIAKRFDAQLVILECKSIITTGYKAIMHMNCIAEEVTVELLICKVNKKTGEKSMANKLRFVKQDDVAIVRLECAGVICVTIYKDFPQMGRFTVREDNKIIAIGKVLKLVE